MQFHVHVYFKSPYYSDTVSCVTYSQIDTLNVPGVLCYWIPKQVDDRPLWGHTMHDRRIIFDVLLLVKFIIFLGISNLAFITPNIDVFLIAGHPATDGNFWQAFKFKVHCGSAFELGASRLPLLFPSTNNIYVSFSIKKQTYMQYHIYMSCNSTIWPLCFHRRYVQDAFSICDTSLNL